MIFKKRFPVLLVLLLILSLLPLQAAFANLADQKIEILLSVGTSGLDLTDFADDIRSVVYQSYGIPKENISVTKAGATIVDSKNNFNWTIYDHYYSDKYSKEELAADWTVYHSIYQPFFYHEENPYLVDSNKYFNDVSLTDESLTSCYNRSQHIYPKENDIYFVGYSVPAYKDFMLYPDTNTGEKTIQFQIQEGAIDTHTLEGAGFLFNASIEENLLNGYLVLYDYPSNYKSSNLKPSIKLYKLTNVNADKFHHESAQKISSLASSSNNGIELLASKVSQSNATLRNIKIRVAQDSFKFYEDEVMIYDTTAADEEVVIKDTSAGGFGPLVSYYTHGCDSLSYFVFKNLTMETYKPLTFLDIVNNMTWQENTKRFLVNLDDDGVDEFTNREDFAQIAALMREDNVHYIGWGLNNLLEGVSGVVYNKDQAQEFISENAGKGIFIAQDEEDEDNYDNGIAAIAKFINDSVTRPATEPDDDHSGSGGSSSHRDEAKITFPDMDKHWAKDNVERLAALKIVQGYPDGNFAPDKAVTRAEFAAMLVRVFEFAKVELVQTSNGTFTDVSESNWYFDVVNRLAPEGIILGYPDGTFGPNKLITREEASAMLARTMAKFNIEPAEIELSFTDKNTISPWARPSVSKASSQNIVQGMPDGSFLPSEDSTRAQAAVMLYRLLDKLDLL